MTWASDRGLTPTVVDDCRAHRLSDRGKAILVWCRSTQDTHWVPVSQIHPDSDIHEPGDEGALVVPQWLAAEKFGVYE